MKKQLSISIVYLFMLIIVTQCTTKEKVPTLWGELSKGEYQVGFQAVFLEDSSRTFFNQDTLNVVGRPIRVLMWYPSHAEKKNMVVEDYVNISIKDSTYRDFNAIFNQIEYGKMARLQSPNKEVADSLLPIILEEGVAGMLNVKPASGSFPLLLHSLGRNGSQLESFVLWEYLASHGFAIAVIPQLGPRPQKFNNISWTAEDLNVQKEDLIYTLKKVKKMNFIDSTRVGFIGYSSGGVIGNWLAAQRNDIDALATLDGAQTTKDGILMLDTLGVSSRKIKLPLLNIYNSNNHLLDMSYMDSLANENRFDVKMTQVTHFDFNQWPLYYHVTNIADERGTNWRTPKDAAKSYELMCQLVETFFSNYLYGETSTTASINNKLQIILNESELAEPG